MIGTRLSHYSITGELGAGGMGEVFRATDTQLGREVAIKVLPSEVGQDPERLARFRREAQLLAALNHPNVAAIYGLEEVDGRPFLVLELVPGETLAERMERGPLPTDEAVDVARQIATALEAAHEAGIVHRDLKPANVKLTPGGEVKVLDFGLAKAYAGDPSTSVSVDLSQSPTLAQTGTRLGVILGTAGYMSPEQARGRSVDKRADVWAFGVLLYEMLSGVRLFTGETASDVLAGVLRAELDLGALPPGVPPALQGLLRRCLDRDPRSRLRDIGEARIVLESPETSRAEPAPVAGPKGRDRTPIWAWSGWALAAVLFAASAWLASRSATVPEREVVRASILPPADASLEYSPGHPGPPAISPDGRHVAFAARNTAGEVRLYVRSLDALAPRAIEGTEGAGYPFWSPDSRSIAYFAAGKLAAVDVDGSGHRLLCDASLGKGGSWGSDGVIVFAPSSVSALHQVPANGGEAVPVTALDSEAGDASHRHPSFLPRGRRFLYVARRPGDGEGTHEVMLGSLDDEPSIPVVLSPAAAEYSQGHLFYLRGDALVAQPFDLDRLELYGDPFQVGQDVMLVLGTARGAFSVSRNGLVVYQPGTLSQRTRLEWLDRGGEHVGYLTDSLMPAFDLRLSPDGQRLVAGVADFTIGTLDLWTYEASRGVGTRFTFDPVNDRNPVWSPDGGQLAFATDREAGSVMNLKSYGGTEEADVILESEQGVAPTDWSADGSTLVFTRQSDETGADLWTLSMKGDKEARVFRATRFDESAGRLSPDGRWLTFVSNESGRSEVYVMPFPDPGRRWQVSSAGGVYPHWVRDGREIVYQEDTGRLVAVAVEPAGEGLRIGAGEELFIAPAPTAGFLPFSMTADGERFIVARPERDQSQQPLTLLSGWAALAPR